MEEFWKEVGILDYANNFKYSRLENEWRRPISEIERQTRRQTRRQEYLDTVGRIEREDLVT